MDPVAKTGGPAGALSKDQYEGLLDYIGEQVKLYQDAQAAARSKGKETASESPLDPEAPGPSGAGAPHIGLAVKRFSKPSLKDLWAPIFLEMIQMKIWRMALVLWTIMPMKMK